MSARHIFLTGPPGIGKTTVIMRTVSLLRQNDISVGGMITNEIREGRSRVGFEVIDIFSNKRGILAHVTYKYGPRVGKYRVNIQDLERVGVNAILHAIENCDVIVIDEIGKMELFSPKFVKAVETALASNKVILGTVHMRATHPLARRIRQGLIGRVIVIRVTYQNRDILPEQLYREVISYVGRRY